jgi:hypothetical protein
VLWPAHDEDKEQGDSEGSISANVTAPLTFEVLFAVGQLISQEIPHLIDIKKNESVQIPIRAFSLEISCQRWRF